LPIHWIAAAIARSKPAERLLYYRGREEKWSGSPTTEGVRVKFRSLIQLMHLLQYLIDGELLPREEALALLDNAADELVSDPK